MARSAMAMKTNKARADAHACATWTGTTACMLEYMFDESHTRYNRGDIMPDYIRYTPDIHITSTGKLRFTGGYYVEYRHTPDGYDYSLADGPRFAYAGLNKPRTVIIRHARDLAQFRCALDFIENKMTPEIFVSL